MNNIRHVPIKTVAEELCLPIYEISTFTGWSAPDSISLILAVSFGLKVPPRLLKTARYGGLNLHPSLLPDLRGPAPLHHTLLEGRTTSGITLQTLHPERFDQGLVVTQSTFNIPDNGRCSLDDLREYVAPVAAELLVNSLRSGSYARPDSMSQQRQMHKTDSHARKITSEDVHVDWTTWPAERILRTQRALGAVWSRHCSPGESRPFRIQWHDMQLVPDTFEDGPLASAVGEPHIVYRAGLPVIRTSDGMLLAPDSVTIEGRRRHEDPIQAVRALLDGRL